MTIFIIIYILSFVCCILKSKYRLLCNEIFWLFVLWLFIGGVYLLSNIKFGTYGLSFELSLFVFLSFGFFFLGRKYGYNKNYYTVFKSEHPKVSYVYILVGVLGVFLLLFDIWRLNGIGAIIEKEAGVKGEYTLSIIGIVGSLLVPILLVEGLYLTARKIKQKNSISFWGLLLLFIYIIPCVLDNGRETILYSIVGLLAMWGYKNHLVRKTSPADIETRKKSKPSRERIIRIISIAGIMGLLYIMYQISTERFGETEIRVFLLENDVPSNIIKDADKWGEFSFIYYNIISYFGHQIPFLDFILQEYDGPYMFGMYEFNIISRRLPDSLGLDYMQVYTQINKLYSAHNTSFGNGWFTALGSFIIDYGRIGAVVVCSVCGYLVGNVRRKFILTKDPRYATLIGIICLSMISTVQLGPFYSTHIYGAFIWWCFIFLTKNKQRITIKKQ